MNMTPVDSSQLHSVGYDPATQRLHIKFKSGGVYEYHDVPPETHKGLLDAPSKGQFFGKNIRGVHAFTKLEAQP